MKDMCVVPGCKSEVKGRGLCNMHYFRAKRSGTLDLFMNRTERARAFITACCDYPEDSCMEPEFKTESDYPSVDLGYGQEKIGRIVLELTSGPCPPHKEMRHLCGNRRCCNSEHLVWGTHLENMWDWKIHGCAGDRTGRNNANYKHGRYSKK